jgi:Tol biopolymer transport system component
MAYVSDESGRTEVYVLPYGGTTGRIKVSSKGGTAPRWTKDRKELLYLEYVGLDRLRLMSGR